MSRSGPVEDLVLRPSPTWRLFLEDDHVVLTAGADETFLIDELSPEEARDLERRWASGSIGRDGSGSPGLAAVLALMEKAGALHAGLVEPQPVLRFGALALGAAARPVVAALTAMAGADPGLVHVEPGEAPALGVLVRGDVPLLAALDEAGSLLEGPHLLIDVAFAHTLSVGPFVWPGRTACLGCFAGRIAHAWGDPAPPPEPRAARAPELAAALALEQLRAFRDHGGCPFLVERAVSLDLATLESRTDHVFRLPWCPRCQRGTEEQEGAGSFALPWRRPAPEGR